MLAISLLVGLLLLVVQPLLAGDAGHGAKGLSGFVCDLGIVVVVVGYVMWLLGRASWQLEVRFRRRPWLWPLVLMVELGVRRGLRLGLSLGEEDGVCFELIDRVDVEDVIEVFVVVVVV